MALDKIQFIGYFAILVIIVSLASIGLKLTGYATTIDTAVVNVTITSSAAINFTTDFVSFGGGTVNSGKPNATVNTEGVLTDGTGWVPTNNLTLENIGNVNVSLALSSSKAAATFLGGTNPAFQFRVINVTEPLSCIGGDAASYTEITTSNDTICTTFPFRDSSDEITIAIQLVIPSDSYSGTTAQTATITATGTS